MSYQPTVETKNRKPMRPNPLAPWELHVGGFRVYYLTTHGKPMVALLFIGNVDWETMSLSTNPDFLEIIEESRKSLRTEGRGF